jgi:hypothetical protein
MSNKSICLGVLVDGIQDFYRGGDYLGENPFALASKPDATVLLREWQEDDFLLISLEDDHGDVLNYNASLEGHKLDKPHGLRGTDGFKLEPEFAEVFAGAEYVTCGSDLIAMYGYLHGELSRILEKGVVRLKKDTFGAQNYLVLLNVLRDAGFEIAEVHMVGVLTGMCDISNVVLTKTAVPDAEIFVHAASCADLDDKLHAAALDSIRRLHADVV